MILSTRVKYVNNNGIKAQIVMSHVVLGCPQGPLSHSIQQTCVFCELNSVWISTPAVSEATDLFLFCQPRCCPASFRAVEHSPSGG